MFWLSGVVLLVLASVLDSTPLAFVHRPSLTHPTPPTPSNPPNSHPLFPATTRLCAPLPSFYIASCPCPRLAQWFSRPRRPRCPTCRSPPLLPVTAATHQQLCVSCPHHHHHHHHPHALPTWCPRAAHPERHGPLINATLPPTACTFAGVAAAPAPAVVIRCPLSLGPSFAPHSSSPRHPDCRFPPYPQTKDDFTRLHHGRRLHFQ